MNIKRFFKDTSGAVALSAAIVTPPALWVSAVDSDTRTSSHPPVSPGGALQTARNEPQRVASPSLVRWIGTFYVLVGTAGLIVLLLFGRPEGFEVFSKPLTIIAMTLLFLALIVIGLFMAVLKRESKMTFLD